MSNQKLLQFQLNLIQDTAMGCMQGKQDKREGQRTQNKQVGFDNQQIAQNKPQKIRSGPFGLFKREQRVGNKTSKKYFAIQSVHSEKILDVQEGKKNADAIIWSDHGRQNQQFTFSPNGQGQYRIRNKQTKQYLTVSGSEKGAKLYFRDGENNNRNQLFQLEQVGQRTYMLTTFYKMVVDVQNCSKSKGAHIIQWERNGGDNQKWRMMDPNDVTSSSSDWEGGW